MQESLFKTSCNFIRKETLAQVFSFEFWKSFKDTFFAERLQLTASAPCWRDTQEVHKTGESINCYTKLTTGMLVKYFKNSHKEISFNKVSDLYQQLTSLGSIFQWRTFFIHYSEHLFMDAADYLYQFCDFCLSFAKILRLQKQYANNFHWNSWWGNFSYSKVLTGFPGICCCLIIKRGNQLKYFQAPQSSYRNYISLVFSTSTRRRNLVQMLIISGDKWLYAFIAQRHRVDTWKPLSIIAKNYFSYMCHEHMPMTSVTSLVKPGIFIYLLL